MPSPLLHAEEAAPAQPASPAATPAAATPDAAASASAASSPPPGAATPDAASATAAPAGTASASPPTSDASAAPSAAAATNTASTPPAAGPATPANADGAAPGTAPATASANGAATATPGSTAAPAGAAATAGAPGEPKKIDESLASEVNKSAGIAKLVKMLKNNEGKPAKIIVLKPIDYTTQDFSELASTNIQKTMLKYGKFNIETNPYHLPSLTLEEFRKVVARTKGDIVFVTVLKPTNFDLFMYDRRTPYYIYAHSEVLPENIQYKLTKDVVTEYSRLLIRRLLYSFIQGQYYELPREETPQLLHAEIPRWIATNDTLAVVNRDINSNAYMDLGYGAALSMGGTGGGWNSNLFSGAIGVRVYNDFFIQAGLDAFAYNALNIAGVYAFVDRDATFRYYVGFGGALAFNQHTINFDQSFSQGGSNGYAMGTAMVTFPVLDIQLKLEGRIYLGLGQSTSIFALTPGILVLF